MFKILCFTSDSDKVFCIEEENENAVSFYMEFLSIFSNVDKKNRTINLIPFHKMNSDLKQSISDVIKKYEVLNIRLRQLGAFFTSIKNDEHFFISPDQNLSIEQNIYIHENINLLNSGAKEEDYHDIITNNMDQYRGLFSKLLEDYDIIHIDPPKKQFFGEKEKKSRCCRYCGGTVEKGSTFNDIAHTIPESLGNKTIISYEECDKCNSKFANSIEEDLFEFFKIYRVMYGMKGKSGIPTLKFKNGTEVRYVDGKCCIFQLDNGEQIDPTKLSIPLEYYRPLNFMNIYRALVKSVIGILDKNDLQYLEKTIEWINNIKNDGSRLRLPKVAVLIDRQNYHEQPSLTLYRRKKDSYDTPFMYAEIKVAMFIYVFIIPFSSKDEKDFSLDENFQTFWNQNKHYCHFDSWVYNDFGLDESKDFIYNLNFSQRK